MCACMCRRMNDRRKDMDASSFLYPSHLSVYKDTQTPAVQWAMWCLSCVFSVLWWGCLPVKLSCWTRPLSFLANLGFFLLRFTQHLENLSHWLEEVTIPRVSVNMCVKRNKFLSVQEDSLSKEIPLHQSPLGSCHALMLVTRIAVNYSKMCTLMPKYFGPLSPLNGPTGPAVLCKMPVRVVCEPQWQFEELWLLCGQSCVYW